MPDKKLVIVCLKCGKSKDIQDFTVTAGIKGICSECALSMCTPSGIIKPTRKQPSPRDLN